MKIEPQMNSDKHRFLYKDETHQIIGCAMEVINTLGHGLLEKPYENALTVEFKLQKIPFQQQPRFPVVYKSSQVGEYIPDIIVFNKIIIDTKTIERIGNSEKGQMINYLKITGLKVGLIINFKHPQLDWKRVIL